MTGTDSCYRGADGAWKWRRVSDVESSVVAVSGDGNYVLLRNSWILERIPRGDGPGAMSDPCVTCFFRSSYSSAFLALDDAAAAELLTGADAVPRYCREALGLPSCEAGKPLILPRSTLVTMTGAVFRRVPRHHAEKIRARHFHG